MPELDAVTEQRLMAVTPIDGRYGDKTEELQGITSEFALIRNRVSVEAGWLATLGSGVLPDVEPFGDVAQDYLRRGMVVDFTVADAAEVKAIEKKTNHDVKAVEMWMRDKTAGTNLGNHLELIHFGATSEDINNLAYAEMVRQYRELVHVPNVTDIAELLSERASEFADLPMLSRTHGQAATPTTVGKELAVFAERLREHLSGIGSLTLTGKFNSASGNYNAMAFAYPEVNWPAIAAEFVRSRGLDFKRATTQIEPHDNAARFFREVATGNGVLHDLATDEWLYIALNLMAQKTKDGEVGSSIMPHKVNPIDFENAEGNLGMANALFEHFATKLQRSRLQRDLSDSTVQRAMGMPMGLNLIALKSMQRGLGKTHPNEVALAADLEDSWAVLAEPVQTVLRRYGVTGAYDRLKERTRGHGFTEDGYREFVISLGEEIPEGEVARLLALSPATYLGYAPEIARGEV